MDYKQGENKGKADRAALLIDNQGPPNYMRQCGAKVRTENLESSPKSTTSGKTLWRDLIFSSILNNIG